MQNKYLEVKTNVRTCEGATKEFAITIGLHKGCILNSNLFAPVFDKITLSL